MENLRHLASFVLAAFIVLALSEPSAAQGQSESSELQVDAVVTQAHLDQISRLYQTVVARPPDDTELNYWAGRAAAGYPLAALAGLLMSTDDYEALLSSDAIENAYLGAFGRQPDPASHDYWSQFDPSFAFVAIADSAELVAATGTEDPPSSTRYTLLAIADDVDIPVSWVDAGNGVHVPPVLLAIRWCESTDDYQAANPASSARGGYQFLRSSWRGYGHAARFGVTSADQASPAQQDKAAVITWEEYGTSPWAASRHCWS